MDQLIKETQKVPLTLMDLPQELRDLIVTYCSYGSCLALLLTSKAFYASVVAKNNQRTRNYGVLKAKPWSLNKPLFMIEERFLDREPEGQLCYAELKSIYKAALTDISKQQALEEAALKSPEHARLILFNIQWWESFHHNDPIARATFIYQIARQWPEAMYYALENDTLRTQWLPVMLQFKCQKFGSLLGMSHLLQEGETFEEVDTAEKYNKHFFRALLQLSLYKDRSILYKNYRRINRKVVTSVIPQIAFLWSTKSALRALLIEYDAYDAKFISLLHSEPALFQPIVVEMRESMFSNC